MLPRWSFQPIKSIIDCLPIKLHLESINLKTLNSQIATQKPEKETRQLSAFYMEQLKTHPDITVNDENAKTWSQLARFYQGKIRKIFLIRTINNFSIFLIYTIPALLHRLSQINIFVQIITIKFKDVVFFSPKYQNRLETKIEHSKR